MVHGRGTCASSVGVGTEVSAIPPQGCANAQVPMLVLDASRAQLGALWGVFASVTGPLVSYYCRPVLPLNAQPATSSRGPSARRVALSCYPLSLAPLVPLPAGPWGWGRGMEANVGHSNTAQAPPHAHPPVGAIGRDLAAPPAQSQGGTASLTVQ